MLGMENRYKRKHLAKSRPAVLPHQPREEPQSSLGQGRCERGSSPLAALLLLLKCLRLITEQLEELSAVWVASIDGLLREVLVPVCCAPAVVQLPNMWHVRVVPMLCPTQTVRRSFISEHFWFGATQKQSTWWWEIPLLCVGYPVLGAFLKEHSELCD